MKNVIFGTALAVLGGFTAPVMAEKSQVSVATVAAELFAQSVDGWSIQDLEHAHLDVIFGDALTRDSTTTEVAARAVEQTTARGQRTQFGLSQSAGDDKYPVMHALAQLVAAKQDLKTTARRGQRRNANQRKAVPAFVYTRDEQIVVVMLSQTAPKTTAATQGVQVASKTELSNGVAADQFLNVAGVDFVELGAPDILPSRSFAGQVGKDAHILVAALAEPDAIRAVLQNIDLTALEARSTPQVSDNETGKSRRKRR